METPTLTFTIEETFALKAVDAAGENLRSGMNTLRNALDRLDEQLGNGQSVHLPCTNDLDLRVQALHNATRLAGEVLGLRHADEREEAMNVLAAVQRGELSVWDLKREVRA